ncbi:restriction endonuclease subunit S, partial [Pseudomonas sp. NBRC 111128]
LDLEQNRPVADVRIGYSYFEDGDVAFAKVTPCFENGKGALMRGLQKAAGFGTTELTVLRPQFSKVDASYLNYVVQDSRFRSLGTGAMTGAGGLKRVPDEFTRNFPVALPLIEEQRVIATHLERETTRIDGLIEKKTRFIKLLREKRQALITYAVTKGLDPNVKMKDSGLEWLGKVPEHWAQAPLKRLVSSIGQGWSPECEARKPDRGEWGVVKVGCVNGGVFRPQESKALPAAIEPRPELGLRKGDVLVSRANTRELVGSCAVVPQDYPHLLLCDKLYRIGCGVRVTPEFLAALITVYGRRAVEIEANGASSSMVNIAQSVILDLLVAVPSKQEQKAIMDRAVGETMRIETMLVKTERSIALLKERRSALITAAVTGQIDLREAV